jgi:hypothetical protein
MRFTVKDPHGRVVGSADDKRLTVTDPRLKRHLEVVLRHGVPIGPDAHVRGRPGIGILLDYLVRAGFTLEEDGGVKKVQGISESGSEFPSPGHVVGDTSPAHLFGPPRKVRHISKDMGGTGAPVTGGMVSTPTPGSGARRRRVRR